MQKNEEKIEGENVRIYQQSDCDDGQRTSMSRIFQSNHQE
jgi:hypothetical protein